MVLLVLQLLLAVRVGTMPHVDLGEGAAAKAAAGRRRPSVPPQYHGCLEPNATRLRYCDSSLSAAARVEDILTRLTIDEKIGLLSPHDAPEYCRCLTAPVTRIGLPSWTWLSEVNSGAAGGCSGKNGTGRCPTVFIGPAGVAASFNRSSWWAKGDVVSTEMRVQNNLNSDVALSGFGPNINLVKDPRYGRNSELPGECPFLSGTYAVHYLRGMQQVSSQGHVKMLAYVKHFTAYNKEANRYSFGANVSDFDLWDSYLPQFEMAFSTQKGHAAGAMCSYFAPNGVPSCGSDFLMNGVVRKLWNRSDAVFMSDCGAVAEFIAHYGRHDGHGYADNETDASSKALNAGLDIYGGNKDDLWTAGFLHGAINAGQSMVSTLNQAVQRTLMQKMKAGVFDNLLGQEWVDLGQDSLNSSHAQQVAYEASLQGLVLLKNDASTLPLRRGVHLAVLGPLAFETTGLLSDYAQWAASHTPPSIASALAASNTNGTTESVVGVKVDSTDASGIPAALAAARNADVVVLVLGITKAQEHEMLDRKDTKLPGLQRKFADQVIDAARGKPVVLVLCNGGIVSFDALNDSASAIIEAFNPVDHGTRALAESIFGAENRWGKLPVTIYGEAYTAALDAAGAGIANYEFAKAPGRGYRYYEGSPLYAFGHGLSYVKFNHTCIQRQGLSFSCTIRNLGDRAGDEVLMVFHSVSSEIKAAAPHPVPKRDLVEFARLTIQARQQSQVNFNLTKSSLAITIANGSKWLYEGSHVLTFSRGTGDRGDETSIVVTM
jgi:beta-D-xylosidase 4